MEEKKLNLENLITKTNKEISENGEGKFSAEQFLDFVVEKNSKGEVIKLKDSVVTGYLTKSLKASSNTIIRDSMIAIEDETESNLDGKFFFFARIKKGVFKPYLKNSLKEKKEILGNPKFHIPLTKSVVQG